MASSSSWDHNKSYQYDVFLSFSGEDVRKTFIDHLYVALDQQGICTFKDDERLEKGKKINDELLQSIKDSRLYIIVFSKHYASSSWCLNELLKIMECHKTDEHTAFPVFYDVDPSEVRKQNGLVGDALATLKNNSEPEVEKWREALQEAANLSGWDVRKTADGHEAKVIKLIVQRVLAELRITDVNVDDNLVGMEQRMQDLDMCLKIGFDDVRMIGIKGMGGAGKTTLARAIFDKMSIYFEGKSFVENVREKSFKSGLEKLQEQVLQDVCMNNNITVRGIHEGKNLMKKKLYGKKVLVVLDDVDHKDHLEALAGDTTWFKPGSRIIITTREEKVLKAHRVKWIRDVNLLTEEEAICLFSRHAFGKDIPTQEYEKHSLEVVSYAAGLPLTIKVLGSDLRGKDASEWADILKRLKTVPLKETLKILELSYENLEDDHKEIFLDVACFLRGCKKEYAIKMLESRGFFANAGLIVLEEKSLIKTSKDSYYGWPSIQMHDHLVEMAKNIVCHKHANEPNKHSRLWAQKEIEHVLASDLVNEATRCIQLEITPHIALERLRNMKTLKCLIVNFTGLVEIDEARTYFPNSLQYLSWHRYPHWHLPKTFEATNLVGLEMPLSNIKQLWEEGKVMKNLKFLNLSFSKLMSLDLGMTPNLESLDLTRCEDLVEVYTHEGKVMKNLKFLNLTYSKLRSLDLGMTPNLEWLNLKHCCDLVEVYGHKGKVTKNLKFLNLSWTILQSLDLGMTPNLESLDLSFCHKLVKVDMHGGSLKSLIYLNLSRCGSLKSFKFIEQFESVEVIHMDGLNSMEFMDHIFTGHSNNSLLELHLYGSTLVEVQFQKLHLPGSICTLKHLRTLSLHKCIIEELPEDLDQLECLEKLDLSGSYFKHFPRSICKLKRLRTLLLSYCISLDKLPEDIGQLESLETLDLSFCYNLREIPNNICKLKRLKELNLERCERLKKVVDGLRYIKCLQLLNIKGSGITHLPPGIHLLKGLTINTSLEFKYDRTKRQRVT